MRVFMKGHHRKRPVTVALFLGLTVFAAICAICSINASACLPIFVRACPRVYYPPASFVMVDLKYIPPDAAMSLLAWYDRSTTLQKAGWAILLVLALATAVLMINRTVKYVRASRQNWLFISLANDLVIDQPAAALSVASNFTASPVARVVSASVSKVERDEFKLSTTARHFAISALTVELTRGLATLGAIATATPLLGAAVATDRLIYYLRSNISFELTASVLQLWMSDWLLCLLAALVLASIATWAHRLLAAKANRLLLEMDRLSLAITSRILNPAERPPVRLLLPAPLTTPFEIRATRARW